MVFVDHAQATELFSAYWDQELGPEERATLEEHLTSCVVCRRDYQTFKKALGAVGTLDKQLAPPDFADAVRSRIRKRSHGRFFTPRRMVERIPYELFSLVMLGLILAIYVVIQLSQPGHLQLP